jgi:hypothetical protein
MNVPYIQNQLRAFIRGKRTSFDHLVSSETQILELAALSVAATHYERLGYVVTPENLVGGRFKVKVKSGYRDNFSWFSADRDGSRYEIHANLGVQSAYQHDRGIYVVDVAVTRGESRANRGPGPRDEWVANKDVVTFLEVKKLVAYPMLLAQFLGIVHEIKPNFLSGRRPPGFVRSGHFDPALLTIGHLSGTATAICDGFVDRKFRITVITNFDSRVSWLSRHKDELSPLTVAHKEW